MRGEEASKATAEKMAAICERIGDKDKLALANKSISKALVQSGKADQACTGTKQLHYTGIRKRSRTGG